MEESFDGEKIRDGLEGLKVLYRKGEVCVEGGK
jgi:hypothetical protein